MQAVYMHHVRMPRLNKCSHKIRKITLITTFKFFPSSFLWILVNAHIFFLVIFIFIHQVQSYNLRDTKQERKAEACQITQDWESVATGPMDC